MSGARETSLGGHDLVYSLLEIDSCRSLTLIPQSLMMLDRIYPIGLNLQKTEAVPLLQPGDASPSNVDIIDGSLPLITSTVTLTLGASLTSSPTFPAFDICRPHILRLQHHQGPGPSTPGDISCIIRKSCTAPNIYK